MHRILTVKNGREKYFIHLFCSDGGVGSPHVLARTMELGGEALPGNQKDVSGCTSLQQHVLRVLHSQHLRRSVR